MGVRRRDVSTMESFCGWRMVARKENQEKAENRGKERWEGELESCRGEPGSERKRGYGK